MASLVATATHKEAMLGARRRALARALSLRMACTSLDLSKASSERPSDPTFAFLSSGDDRKLWFEGVSAPVPLAQAAVDYVYDDRAEKHTCVLLTCAADAARQLSPTELAIASELADTHAAEVSAENHEKERAVSRFAPLHWVFDSAVLFFFIPEIVLRRRGASLMTIYLPVASPAFPTRPTPLSGRPRRARSFPPGCARLGQGSEGRLC